MFRRVGTSDSSQHNELEEDYQDYSEAEFLSDLEVDADELIETFERVWMPTQIMQQEMERLQMKKDAKLEILKADGIRCGQNKERGSELREKLEGLNVAKDSSDAEKLATLENISGAIKDESEGYWNQKHMKATIEAKRTRDKEILEADVIPHRHGFVRAKLDEEK